MKKLKTPICLLFVLCFLWGCASDPARRREVPSWWADRWLAPCREAIPSTPILPGEAETEEKWKAHEGPWQIVDLISIALENNPTTMETWENARAAAYSWKASQSTLLPVIVGGEELVFQKFESSSGSAFSSAAIAANTSANGGTPVVTGGGASSTGGSFTRYNQWLISTLSFSYLMLDFGGRLASIEAARQALLVADWTHNRNIQTVIFNTMTDAYLYLQAKALYGARLDDLKNATENFNAANGQFQAGVARKLDVLLAQSNLANAELILQQQLGVVHTSLGQLAAELGLPADVKFDVAELPEDNKYEMIADSMEKLIATAKIERPDLAAAEANWKEEDENAWVTWSAGMPTLTANGFLENSRSLHHRSLSSREYSASFMLNVPIFRGFFYVNSTRSALATAASAYAAWKEEEQQVILDVVTSYYNFQTAVETVKNSEEYYKYTMEAYDVAFASYRNGVGTILDLLAAQSALSNARAQRIQARTQWFIQLANVSYATGML